jgi:hypothetical protein
MLQALCERHRPEIARDPQVEKLAGNADGAEVIAEIEKRSSGEQEPGAE